MWTRAAVGLTHIAYQILNENFVWRPWSNGDNCTPLTKEAIQKMTYSMSFQYGTATKAVRMVPVVKYAVKLGNIASGYLPGTIHVLTVVP
jgi:hypothetical protein